MTKKIVVDLDNTITIEDPSVSYEDKAPNKKVIKALNKLNKDDILIFTARNMRSFNGDLEKINNITKPIAQKWLKENNVEYDEIIMGKPWCGHDGFYVDDKNLSIDEFIFKYNGPYSEYSVDVVIPFFNEEKNIELTHESHKKLEKIFNINNFIYVNNGSIDNTLMELEKVSRIDKKVLVVDLKNNIGYGNGMKTGIKSSNADFIITNHADGQFDAYTFFLTHLDDLSDSSINIIPERLNRSFIETLNTYILNKFISIIRRKKVIDFNGQPKIFKRSLINDIDSYPDDFIFDFHLYKRIEDHVTVKPIIQKKRAYGDSSWSSDIIKRLSIFLEYIRSAFKK